MAKVLAVCVNNLGRSLVTEKLLKDYGVDADSAGIKNEEIDGRRSRFQEKYGKTPEQYLEENGGKFPYAGDDSIDAGAWIAGGRVSGTPAYFRALREIGKGRAAKEYANSASRAVTASDLEGADVVLTATKGIAAELEKNYPVATKGKKGRKVFTMAEFAGEASSDLDDPFRPKDDKRQVYRTLDGEGFDCSKVNEDVASGDTGRPGYRAVVASARDMDRVAKKCAEKVKEAK